MAVRPDADRGGPRVPAAGALAAGGRGALRRRGSEPGRGAPASIIKLFANRRVVIVPGGIGVSGGRTVLYGHIVDALWHAAAWTLEPAGVIHLGRSGAASTPTSSPIWGEPLDSRRLLTFEADGSSRVLVFVNGKRRPGAPGDLRPGRPRSNLVVEINGYIPPHSSFAFARDRRSCASSGSRSRRR